jgi:hypothetical protein
MILLRPQTHTLLFFFLLSSSLSFQNSTEIESSYDVRMCLPRWTLTLRPTLVLLTTMWSDPFVDFFQLWFEIMPLLHVSASTIFVVLYFLLSYTIPIKYLCKCKKSVSAFPHQQPATSNQQPPRIFIRVNQVRV